MSTIFSPTPRSKMQCKEEPVEPVGCGVKIKENIYKRLSYSVNDRSKDAISVYVRLKPKETSKKDGFITYNEDENTVVMKKKAVEQLFRFTHVFKPETTQEEVFEYCAKPLLENFLDGQSAFIFTYGPSCSGKTFTIQGEKGKPGLIPRILSSLFSSIDKYLDQLSPLCPDQGSEVTALSDSVLTEKTAYKKKLLALSKNMKCQVTKADTFVSMSEIESLETENFNVKEQRGIYSIWISFYEIYNEKVYDLFGDPKDTRKPLRLMSDKDSKVYIKGLNHIQVNNIQEAFLLYSFGRSKLSMNSTIVNDQSSRSHSIFTIKVIGRVPDNCSSYFLSSSFSVCDLAGTERAHKTGNEGLKLREAQQINSSFLVLNRCLRTIRENQSLKIKKHIPYRDSKLTQILGPSLTSCETSLVMIVTVSQSDAFIEETECALKSSSVALTIRAFPPPPPARPYKRGRFSVAVSKCMPGRVVDWQAVATKSHMDADEKVEAGSLPDVYKELQEERMKRLKAEEKLKEILEIHRLRFEYSHGELAVSPDKKDVRYLEKMLEEQEEEFMASRAEALKLKKDIRILKEEMDEKDNKIKLVEESNDIYKEMLDDAKENVEMLQEHITELDNLIRSKDELILEKNERLEYLEREKMDIEDNLIAHLNECERTISVLEEKLQKQDQENEKLFKKYQNICKDLYDAEKSKQNVEKDLMKQLQKAEDETDAYRRHIDTLENQLKSFEANKCELIRRYELLLETKQKYEENNDATNNKENLPQDKESPLKLHRSKAPKIVVEADSDDEQVPTSGCKNKRLLRTRSEDRRVAYSDMELTEGDPSFIVPCERKSKTTSKKKKPRSKKGVNFPDSTYESSVKSEPPSSTTPMDSSTARSRRKLFLLTSSDMGDNVDSSCDFNVTQSQPSPHTLLKRTLRTRKKN